jgi:tRNA A-37 threonylcarbamoyl transferase component Bud32/tetratricopeptide (TPR) repeat protein
MHTFDGATRVDGQPQRRPTPVGDLPARIGRYVVLRRLGEGAMGVVFAAYDPELDRRVAVKVLGRRMQGRPDVQARIVREAQALARLSHPNVVQLHEAGQIGDQLYLAMELVPGRTLREHATTPGRAWQDILRAYLDAGRGLAAAHRAGLVHRDFKPDNALVGDDGRTRVLDFGVARLVDEPGEPGEHDELLATERSQRSLRGRSALTETDALVGTPAYMAPEQLARGRVDARADQFGFCVALHEALYGARPFAGTTVHALLTAIAAGPVRPPRSDVPGHLFAAIARGLALQPDDRWPDMDALLAALADDPVRRKLTRIFALAATLLIGAAGAAGHALAAAAPPPVDACTGAAAQLPAWDASARRTLERAFAAARTPTAATAWLRTQQRVDGWVDEWQQQYTESCRATRRGEQSLAVLDLRRACLDRARTEFGAVLPVLLGDGIAPVDRAAELVAQLPSVARCADTASLLAQQQGAPAPRDAAAGELARELAQALRAARLQAIATGRLPGDPEARIAQAEALGDPRLIAEALFVAGRTRFADDTAAAADLYRRAFAAAERAGHDELAAEAAIELLYTLGMQMQAPTPALEWAAVARAKLGRLADPTHLRLMLELFSAYVLHDHGDRDAAIVAARAAVALATRVRDARPAAYVEAVLVLGTVLPPSAEAERALLTAIDVAERELGPDHVVTANALEGLAGLYHGRGEDERALDPYRRAMAIQLRIHGAESAIVADGHGNLAALMQGTGRTADALALLRRSVAINTRIDGPDSPTLARPLLALGCALADDAQPAEALVHLRRAHAFVDREQLGRQQARTHACLGAALLPTDPAAARDHLEQAIAAWAGSGATRELGEAHATLAAAWLRLGDPRQAAPSARHAIDLLATVPRAQTPTLWARALLARADATSELPALAAQLRREPLVPRAWLAELPR